LAISGQLLVFLAIFSLRMHGNRHSQIFGQYTEITVRLSDLDLLKEKK